MPNSHNIYVLHILYIILLLYRSHNPVWALASSIRPGDFVTVPNLSPGVPGSTLRLAPTL
jgi:hypothetical protein